MYRPPPSPYPAIDKLRNNDPELKVLNLIDPNTRSETYSYERFKSLNHFYDIAHIRAAEINEITAALHGNTNLHTLMLPICLGASHLFHQPNVNPYIAAITNFVTMLQQNKTLHSLVLMVVRFDIYDSVSDDIITYPYATAMQIMQPMLRIFSNKTYLQHIHLVHGCMLDPTEICANITPHSKLKGLYFYGYDRPILNDNEYNWNACYLGYENTIMIVNTLATKAPQLTNLSIQHNGLYEIIISEIISNISKARYKPNQVQLDVTDNVDGFAVTKLMFSGLNMFGINYNPINDRKQRLMDLASGKARDTLFKCFYRRLSAIQKKDCVMPDVPWKIITEFADLNQTPLRLKI